MEDRGSRGVRRREGIRSARRNWSGIGSGIEIGGRFDQFLRDGAFSFGGVREVVAIPKLRTGIGTDLAFYYVPDGLGPVYGATAVS